MTDLSDVIIDSHVHLCLLHKYNPDRIAWLIEHRCSVISWAFGGTIANVSDLKHYLSHRVSVFRELRRRGLDCYHLCGIHPRKIPRDLRPEAVAGLLVPFLDHPECLGIGEIGLEAGTRLEEEILCAQLEFGLSLGRRDLRFGLHTPRDQKPAITRRLFSLLDMYETLPAMAVVDHCTHGTIGPVLSRGFHAGISLSRVKTSENELVQILKLFGAESDRIMCNTDSGREFHEDLVTAQRNGLLHKDVTGNLFYCTAARFFGIAGRSLSQRNNRP